MLYKSDIKGNNAKFKRKIMLKIFSKGKSISIKYNR